MRAGAAVNVRSRRIMAPDGGALEYNPHVDFYNFDGTEQIKNVGITIPNDQGNFNGRFGAILPTVPDNEQEEGDTTALPPPTRDPSNISI